LSLTQAAVAKQIVKAGLLYFVLVFAVGFVLGVIRTLWVAPRLGTRTAELVEAPIMLIASMVAARWVFRRVSHPAAWQRRLACGILALGMMFLAEFGFVLWIRGLTIREYIQGRDPVAGAVYLATLGAFAVLPVFVARASGEGGSRL